METGLVQQFHNFAELADSWETTDKAALSYESDGKLCQVSYRDLRKRIISRAGEIAAAQSAGRNNSVQETDNRDGFRRAIALRTEATPDFIVSFFAHVIAGVPVLLADPRVPDKIIRATVNVPLRAGSDSEGKDIPRKPASDNPEGKILFYTSGTSNRSRCVVLTSRSLCCSAWSGQCMLPCSTEDTILCLLPLSHVFGFVCGLLWGLSYGATIALGRGVRHIFDDCAYYHPTILPAVPAVANMLDRMNLFNPELRVLLIGAAPCGDALLESIRRKGISVYFGYGLTETSSGIAITQDPDEPFAMYPCPGADIRIERNQDAARSVANDSSGIGEISVATPCMMEGYLGEASPLVNARLMTGDLGRFDEKGRLRIEGRRKDMIVLPDGTKIFCPEYESILTERLETDAIALAELRNRAVLVVEDAAHRMKNGSPDTIGSFQKHVEEEVRHFNEDRSRSQQIADIIYLEGHLPRTAIGKLQRWKLTEMLMRREEQTAGSEKSSEPTQGS